MERQFPIGRQSGMLSSILVTTVLFARHSQTPEAFVAFLPKRLLPSFESRTNRNRARYKRSTEQKRQVLEL